MYPYTYTIHHRTLVDTHPLDDAPVVTLPQLCALPHLSMTKVVGAQAQSFLQGQLTCDLRQVNATTMQSGALCDLKGRVIALIDVLYWNTDFYLIYPQDLDAILQKSLALAARLSRVTLVPAPHVKCYGIMHQSTLMPAGCPFEIPRHPYQVYATPDLACYAITPTLAMVCCEKLLTPTRGNLPWQQALIQQQRMSIYPETSGKFLPHRLMLDKIGWVSFQKGCYRGQEIIARMHYRSAKSYTLILFTHTTQPMPLPGQPWLADHTEPAMGEVIDVAPITTTTSRVLVSVMGGG